VPRRLDLPIFVRLFLLALLGLVVVAGVAVWLNRGAWARLDGRIVKVRTIATDAKASVAVLEIRFANPAATPFVVRDSKLFLTTAGGDTIEGMSIVQGDLDRVLEYHKDLGPRYNPVLRARERFDPGGGPADRTVAASFDVSEAELAARRNLTVRIEDVDGYFAEIPERRR
jgi:hypothetical protein